MERRYRIDEQAVGVVWDVGARVERRRTVTEVREDDQQQTPNVGIALEEENARHVRMIDAFEKNAGSTP
jgi:hypothetical protein